MMVDEALRRSALSAAALLREFSAATVHEANGRRGALAPRLKPLVNGWRICAPVMTISTGPGNNLAIHQGLYATPPGWAMAVATGGDDTFGYWGDILTEAAIAHGVAGLVLEGGIRDVHELRALDFPVVSGAVAIRGTTKLLDGASVGEPISLGGIHVSVGDILIADDDGVVCVALADAVAVATAARSREVHEEHIRTAIRAGAQTLDLYGFTSHDDTTITTKE
ncbi:RraA family protein [Subtercola sp. YIM 133946]|uniref:RraA family protein n=1 Tax=Subtercola sp. YIM 133946 TaxID=3118909 RepID=UPI002F95CB9B